MHNTCPTVKVKADTAEGYAIINESDLTDEHDLFDAPESKPRGKKKAEEPKEQQAE
jgi:hypothetical protein